MSDVNLTRTDKLSSVPSIDPAPPFILQETDKPYLLDMAPKLVEILMSYHAGNSYEATAAAYNIPVGTVRSRIHRARARILKKRQNKSE